MQYLKDEVDQTLARASRKWILQRLRARLAIGQHDGNLTVEQGRLHGQLHGSGDDLWELARPIILPTALQAHPPTLDVATDAIAVILQLVEPLRSVGGSSTGVANCAR